MAYQWIPDAPVAAPTLNNWQQQPCVQIPVNSQSEFERALKFAGKWQAKQERKKKEEESGKKKDDPKKTEVTSYLQKVAVVFAVTPFVMLINAGVILLIVNLFKGH